MMIGDKLTFRDLAWEGDNQNIGARTFECNQSVRYFNKVQRIFLNFKSFLIQLLYRYIEIQKWNILKWGKLIERIKNIWGNYKQFH